ncbi:hypothetical protein NBRC3293_2062 [Gluconobacter oxydans NBRC 3293]|uniref:Uncharacterized protein n=1 Tax=Gluconobacter oxydans NBRC 3293 TaxID=1315969 RepID=A0A829WQX7_GLUOY|nr:hypothetical protein NBRC3293_2062 [Gluconobacter oxydans NBRC 3293]
MLAAEEIASEFAVGHQGFEDIPVASSHSELKCLGGRGGFWPEQMKVFSA